MALQVADGDDGDDGDEMVGFVAMEPWSEAPSDDRLAEVRYVGVSPRAWGGVGRQLMAVIPDALAQAGFEQALLKVYTDNNRAVRLYEGLGWYTHGAPRPQPRSGRPEQQYRLDLTH